MGVVGAWGKSWGGSCHSSCIVWGPLGNKASSQVVGLGSWQCDIYYAMVCCYGISSSLAEKSQTEEFNKAFIINIFYTWENNTSICKITNI